MYASEVWPAGTGIANFVLSSGYWAERSAIRPLTRPSPWLLRSMRTAARSSSSPGHERNLEFAQRDWARSGL